MSWDAFTAFGGKLDSAVFRVREWQHSDRSGQSKISKFITEWIQGLRESPAEYGIPPHREVDVTRLLDAFFPAPSASGDGIVPIRIRSAPGFPDSLRRISPVEVRFGPNDTLVPIADAPNALGYIFSVVRPPDAGNPTLESYLLPLSIFYAWLLYAVFLEPVSSLGPVITNVPVEACLMYLPGSLGASSAPIYFLGATWSGADPGDAEGAASTENDERQMDLWTNCSLVQPALNLNPNAHLPELSPGTKKIAARRLNEYILGKTSSPESPVPSFLSPIFNDIFPPIPGMEGEIGLREFVFALSLLVKADAKQPLGVAVEPDLLIANTKLEPRLMDLLLPFVDCLVGVIDPAKLTMMVQKLVQFYITPHVIIPVSNLELPLGPQSKAILDPLALSLPGLLLPKITEKLESLRRHIQHEYLSTNDQERFIERKYFIADTSPYGRLAETAPVFVLS